MRKIKIIHIIPTLDIGGAERLIVDILKDLDKDLFDVEVVCLKRFGFWGLDLKRHKLKMTLLKQRFRFSAGSFFTLVRLFKKRKPDIVHTHLFGADFYGILAARLSGVKTIISTEHNKNYFEGIIRRKIKKFVYKYATSIVAVSEAVKDYLLSEGVAKEKIIVIHNGVRVKDFFISGKKRSSGPLIIGSVGRLSEQKDFSVLLKAVIKIDGIKMVIAGEGELRSKLEALIKKLNLSDRVELLGNEKDMKKFYKKLDIFVLPSKWEGFGIVILEAGLSGLPVIASRIDGIKEIIENKKDGLLFESGNIFELTKLINKLAVDREQRAKLGRALRKKVENKFSIEVMVKKYEKLYCKCQEN